MVESAKKTKVGQTEKRPVGRPPKARTNLQKVEEVKLGKFAAKAPLKLPERQIKRGWQITWGVALMLGAVIGVYLLLLTVPEYIFGDGVMSGPAIISSNGWYMLVAEMMVLVVTIGSLAASIMMFAKKRVPMALWYVIIGALVIGLICASFRKFRWYEERLCYENYPGIYPGEDRGSGCPSVVGQLSVITLVDLAILAAGMVGVWMLSRKKNRRAKKLGRR